MDKRIIWSLRAADDLEDVYNYIAKNSKYFAAVIVRKIFKIVESIPQFPRSGRIVPEYQNEKLRERLYKSYKIVSWLLYKKNNVNKMQRIGHKL